MQREPKRNIRRICTGTDVNGLGHEGGRMTHAEEVVVVVLVVAATVGRLVYSSRMALNKKRAR